MSSDESTNKKLENFEMDDPIELAKEFKKKDIDKFKDLELESTKQSTMEQINNTAKETIESLDEEELTLFIEKSLKVDGDGDDVGKEWLTYSEMRQNNFYPFMVQAAIDLLSDKLKDEESGDENKYNDEGELDTEKGRTLDQYISDCGGIDNIYGPGTRKVVTMVQKILKINVDGFAGPQFFAKICSVLKGEENVSDFKVHGYNDERPYPFGFEKAGEEAQEVVEETQTPEKVEEVLDATEMVDEITIDSNKYKLPDGYSFGSCEKLENGDQRIPILNNGSPTQQYLYYEVASSSIKIQNGESWNINSDGIFKLKNLEILHYNLFNIDGHDIYCVDGYNITTKHKNYDVYGYNVLYNNTWVGCIKWDSENGFDWSYISNNIDSDVDYVVKEKEGGQDVYYLG